MNTPTETRTQSKPRRLRRKLGLSLLSVVLLLVVGEVLVRTLTDTRRALLVVDAKVGRHYIPNWKGLLYSAESEREVPMSFNRQGLRFEDLPFDKPPGTHRILVVGDSLIAGLEVDQQDTACAQLEAQLARTNPSEHWQVLNFGISGSSTGQEYVLYREIGSKYQADIVLCAFFVGNDFGGNSTRLSHWPYIYFDLDSAGELVQVPFPSPRLRFNALLNHYSRLYVWQKGFVSAHGRSLARSVAAMTEKRPSVVVHGDHIRSSEWIYCRSQNEAAEYTWKVTRALMHAFATGVRSDGARFGIVMIPASEQLYDEDFALIKGLADKEGLDFDVQHPARELAAICAQEDVPFINLLGPLRAATPSHRRDAQAQWHHFKGNGHLNERGHAVVAKALHRALQRQFGVAPENED